MRRPYPPVYVGRKFVCWIAFCWMPAKWPILAGFPLFSRSLAGGIQESQKGAIPRTRKTRTPEVSGGEVAAGIITICF